MKMLSRRKALINELMRQFLINRAQILHHQARQFPKTRRVVRNWLSQALRFAEQVGDEALYRKILCACLPLPPAGKKLEIASDVCNRPEPSGD